MLKSDVDHWKRWPDGHPRKTYEWLLDRMKERIDEARTARNEAALNHTLGGGPGVPPAMPGGKVCPFFLKFGKCKFGDACHMSHDTSGANPKGKGKTKDTDRPKGPKGGGAGGGGGGGGNTVNTKGGNPNSKVPCYRNAVGKCTNEKCNFAHRALTKAEEEERKKNAAKRSPSPAAPAPKAPCPDWLAGKCVLGKECPLPHPSKKEQGIKKNKKVGKGGAAAAATAE